MGYGRDGISRTPLRCTLEDLVAAGTRGEVVRIDGRAVVGLECESGGRGGDCRRERWRRTRPRPIAAMGEYACQAFLVSELGVVPVRCAVGRVLVRLRWVDLNIFGFSCKLKETTGQHDMEGDWRVQKVGSGRNRQRQAPSLRQLSHRLGGPRRMGGPWASRPHGRVR